MKHFLKKIFLYALFPLAVFAVGLMLPATPKAKMSLLMAKPVKDSLLLNVKQPRIIFVGGSSISMGLNSQVFKDSLHLNPINTGIHAGFGLYYIIDNVSEHLQRGDIIVLAPEYVHFFGDWADGGESLLRAAFDTSSRELILKLRWRQLKKMYGDVPKYAMQKFMPNQYFGLKANETYYTKAAFNQYGDAIAHWKFNINLPVVPIKLINNGNFNYDVIAAIKQFDQEAKAKGARLLVSFPPFQKTSFDYCRKDVHFIESQIKLTGAEVIGTPERYTFSDDLLFDSNYHLNKKGVDIRTKLLLEDVKAALKSN